MEDKYDQFHVGIHVFAIRDDKLLLGKRKNVYGAGSWGLPGGHLEQKEKMQDTAKRELFEETGLVANDFEFICLVNDNREDQHYVQVGFMAKDAEGEPILKEPDKCEEWKWFDLDNLPQEIFIGAKDIIKAFQNGLNFVDK